MTFEEIRESFGEYTAVDDDRQRLIHSLVISTAHLIQPMAEVGVYKGGTSYLIANTDPNRLLFACDSFEGLPKPTNNDTFHKQGDFKDTDYETVKAKLNYPQVIVRKGFFPDSVIHSDMFLMKFSFVHIDVDLYESTFSCLMFFYDKMVKDGIIVIDDYEMISCPGVKKAVDEFMKGKPELIVTHGYNNCYIKKLCL